MPARLPSCHAGTAGSAGSAPDTPAKLLPGPRAGAPSEIELGEGMSWRWGQGVKNGAGTRLTPF